MSNRLYIKNIGFLILALSYGLSTSPAHAGFQWVAPSAPTAAPVPESPAPVPESEPVTPVVTGSPQALSPVVIDNNNQPASGGVTPSSVSVSLPPAPVAPAVETPASSKPIAVSPPPIPDNSVPPPVVIEGTSHPSSPKSDMPPPVIIQGNNAPQPAPTPDEGAVPVAGGEIVPLSTQPPIIVSPPSATVSESPPPAVAEASPVMMPEAAAPPAPADVPPPVPSVSAPASTSATVTLSSPQSTASVPVLPASSSEAASMREPFNEAAIPSSSPPSMTPSAPPPSASATDIVHGFANHVPLAVALRQILPTGYGFSVDQNVDLGVLVSFKGGRPWRETLDEALGPAGLVAHDQGQMIEIGYPSAAKELKNSLATADASSAVTLSSSASAAPPPPHASDLRQMPMAPTVIDSSSSLTPAPVASQQAWDAEPGDSLHKVLEDWSRRANVEFDWMAEYDYPLQASVHLKGSFEDAVRGLLIGFEAAHPQPIAELHANPKVGQMVLVVTTRGNSTD